VNKHLIDATFKQLNFFVLKLYLIIIDAIRENFVNLKLIERFLKIVKLNK